MIFPFLAQEKLDYTKVGRRALALRRPKGQGERSARRGMPSLGLQDLRLHRSPGKTHTQAEDYMINNLQPPEQSQLSLVGYFAMVGLSAHQHANTIRNQIDWNFAEGIS